MSAKTYQHRKAIGNARATARGFMVPILRDVTGQDLYGQVENAYGPERVVPATTITVDLSGGDSIIAMGRLERMSTEAVEGDIRLVHKEAYRLYWLPYAWAHAEGDHHGNPQSIGSELNPADVTPTQTSFLVAGSRVWIVLDVDSLSLINGAKAWEFTVVESFRNGVADLVEYEAVVYRSEGVSPRTVVAS